MGITAPQGGSVFSHFGIEVCAGKERHGDIFPLPAPEVESFGGKGLSRGVRQRIGRRIQHQQAAHQAIAALNSLSGATGTGWGETTFDADRASPAQRAVMNRVFEACNDRFISPSAGSNEAALRALLGADSQYGEEGQGSAGSLARSNTRL